ncbi:trehalose-phosphatase [Corynebacterium sp. H128]|uniref:trehalose-phosphatase n=1 Tax=unclassified Corynebacterium TaxID=2624378 RepID=UPI0030A861D0
MDFASPQDITTALSRVASAPRLLVVSDFDGTLAGFAPDAYRVPVNRRSITALQQLGALPATTSVILSGRHREGLENVAGDTRGITLVGSHGADGIVLTPEQQKRLDDFTLELAAIVDGVPGAFVEHKPFHRVLHYRAVDQASQGPLVAAARACAFEGIHHTPGKCIEEFSVLEVTKGTWIAQARKDFEADAVVFLGDDVTDENGMRALEPSDLGVRVGDGETQAHIRVPDLQAVEELLTELHQMRATVLPA